MRLARLLPPALRRRLRPLWWAYLRWPMPLWRLRGSATFELAGHRFRFHDVSHPAHAWWAWRAEAGTWEPEVLRFFADSLRPGDDVLDIGAHVGAYTLLASRLVGDGGRVFAFEPDPAARGALERNIRANGAHNVTVVPSAVTGHDGTVWLQSDLVGDSTTHVSTEGGFVEVEAVTLASFCGRLGLSPSVIKVDVEGGEAGVLADGARALLGRTRAVVVEVHEPALRSQGIDAEAFLRELGSWGKRVVELERRTEFEGNYNVGVV
jgi:FkbM family methyltransferase